MIFRLLTGGSVDRFFSFGLHSEYTLAIGTYE